MKIEAKSRLQATTRESDFAAARRALDDVKSALGSLKIPTPSSGDMNEVRLTDSTRKKLKALSGELEELSILVDRAKKSVDYIYG